MDTAQTSAEIRFGDCRISLKTREIYLGGVRQEATPKAFDLLVLLIHHRDRVVSRDELLEQVWANRVVTDNVVTRAVMLARRSIGDLADPPILIKTVQKIGYRFVGQLEGELDAAQASAGAPPIRIALLPFHNETGDRQFAWIELGLVSLVAQALEADRRLSVESTAQVLSALKEFPSNATDSVRAEQLQRLFNVQCVFIASITRLHARFRMSYRGFGTRGDAVGGSIEGLELTRMAEDFARVIGDNLIARDTIQLRLVSNDPFANECFARAVRAADEKRWRESANLFRVALDLVPESTPGRIKYLEVLAELGDPEAFDLAQQLILESHTNRDTQLEAVANQSLAIAYIEARRDLDKAATCIRRAVELTEIDATGEKHIQALFSEGYLYQVQLKLDEAKESYYRARDLSRKSGNQLLLLAILNNLANLEITSGNLLVGRESFLQILKLSREHGRQLTEYAALINLANVNAMLGLYEEALEHGRAGMTRLRSLKHLPKTVVESPMGVIRIYSEMHMTDSILSLVQELRESLWESGGSLERSAELMARGYLEASKGESSKAAEFMAAAIELGSTVERFRAVRSWYPILVRELVKAGHLQRADSARKSALSLVDASDDEELLAALHHSEAVEAYLCGQLIGAQTQLERALNLAPVGHWRAICSLDLAWMLLEAGKTNEASALLRDYQPWLAQHPAGLIVGARLKYAEGKFVEASRLHDRHLQVVGGRELTSFSGYEQIYCGSDRDLKNTHSKRAPRLPSVY